MAGRVTFILGAAGTGKTWRCLHDIAAEAAADPEGPPLLLLVPEQATFQMERALLGLIPGGATLRAQVMGFQRLAHRVAEAAGGASRPRVGERGREALLEIALRRAGDLRVFRGMAGRPGVSRPLGISLRELAAWRHSPDSLRSAAERVRSADPALADKLADLAAIWSAHRALLHDRFTDPDGLADLAAQRLAASGLAAGAQVWVDGFAGFTPQELAILVALAGAAEHTSIALCVPADARPERPAPGDLFHPTRATFAQLHEALASQGIAIGPAVRLPRAVRFAQAPDLAYVERWLRGEAGRREPPAAKGLSLLPCRDRRAEAEAVAAEIVALCRDRGYRYRDVAVLARDLDAYLPELEDALAAEGIPFFADRRRPLRQHPLAVLCRSALAAVADGWPSAAVLAYLATDLTPLSRAEADALATAALTRGIQGAAWHQPQAWRRARAADVEEPEDGEAIATPAGEAEQLRRRAVAPLLRLSRDLGRGGPLPASQGVAALRALLDRLEVADRLREWDADEDPGQHAAVGEAVARLLDELQAALGHAPLELAELRAAVEAGLDGLTLGLIPPTADQVLLGGVERSRQPELRALFLVGAGDDAFPRAAAEDGVLPDGERARLRAAGAELAPGSAERLWDEPYLAYIALTRASERLYVSWPLRADGRPAREAAVVRGLLARFAPTVAPEPGPGAFPGRVLRGLAEDWRQWLPAYAALRADPDLCRRAAPAFAALGYHNEAAALPPHLAAALFPRPVRLTATRLAAFSACPFQHFATYGLRLRQLLEPRLDAPGLGALLHDALAEVVRGLLGEDFATADDLEERCAAAVAAERPLLEAAGLDPARVRRAEDRLLRAVTATLRAARDEAAAGWFRPVAVELEFREVLSGEAELVGKIDRVDVAPLPDGGRAVRVIDYKSRPRPFRADDVALGLEWQLPLYLGSASRLEEGDPAAMLYQPAQEPVVASDGPLPADEAARRARAAIRASGLLSSAALDASGLDAGLLPVRLKQDGQPTADSSVAGPDTVAALLEATREAAMEAATHVAAGEIAIRPFRRGRDTACQRCLYAALCRFEPREGYREL
jgi:ATP-dependent helicase/nuclease subunit B